jgi:Transketolase, C-terminal domain
MANPGKIAFCLGSDGSQQEGNDAEAARLAVAQNLNVKLIIDDNDVTSAGHPSKYLVGTTVAKTLVGHGLQILEGNGENIDDLYARICKAVNTAGPIAIINHRPMCPGIVGLEGQTHGHDVISVKLAIFHRKGFANEYLESHSQQAAADHLKGIVAPKNTYTFMGSSDKWDANRNVFGDAAVAILGRMNEAERVAKVKVIDSDLEGSCGLKKIHDGKDEVIREGTQGYIVSFGEALYRSLDAVERLKQEGIDIGLINKPTLNSIDEEMMAKVGKSPLVLVVESFNRKTDLVSRFRFDSRLLERGYKPNYNHLGTHIEGCGCLWEQFPHQGIDPAEIMAAVKKLMG